MLEKMLEQRSAHQVIQTKAFQQTGLGPRMGAVWLRAAAVSQALAESSPRSLYFSLFAAS